MESKYVWQGSAVRLSTDFDGGALAKVTEDKPDFPVFSYDRKDWRRTPSKRLLGGSGLTDEKIVSVEQTFTIGTIRQTLDAWKARGNPIDIFVDFHGFSAKNGVWTAPIQPQDYCCGLQAQRYERLLAAIQKEIPGILFSQHQAEGFAAGAGARRFGALALSIDGYIYRWPSEKPPDLSSFFEDGCRIWELNEIKAAGALFVKALADFEAL